MLAFHEIAIWKVKINGRQNLPPLKVKRKDVKAATLGDVTSSSSTSDPKRNDSDNNSF